MNDIVKPKTVGLLGALLVDVYSQKEVDELIEKYENKIHTLEVRLSERIKDNEEYKSLVNIERQKNAELEKKLEEYESKQEVKDTQTRSLFSDEELGKVSGKRMFDCETIRNWRKQVSEKVITPKEIAKELKISYSTVLRAVTGKTYKNC